MDWVDVKERLPEHGQKVLAVVWDDDIVPCTFITRSDSRGHKWFPEVDALEEKNGWDNGYGSLACPKLVEEPRLWCEYPKIPSIWK